MKFREQLASRFRQVAVPSSPDRVVKVAISFQKPGICDVPWSRVARSPAVWAVIVSHFTHNYGLYTLMTTMPTYFNRVQGFDIKKVGHVERRDEPQLPFLQNGSLFALPYLIQCIVHVAACILADLLRTRFNVSTTAVRKGFDCLGKTRGCKKGCDVSCSQATCCPPSLSYV